MFTSVTKEITFNEFKKVLLSDTSYDPYLRITQLPDNMIGILTHRKKRIKETGDDYIWSEYCIVPGIVSIHYKRDLSIPSPYVFHIHDHDADNLITLLSVFNPEKEKLYCEYYAKNNSQNNESTGLNSDCLFITKRDQGKTNTKKRCLSISIKNEWIHTTTMLVSMTDNWSEEIKNTYLKSKIFDKTVNETYGFTSGPVQA